MYNTFAERIVRAIRFRSMGADLPELERIRMARAEAYDLGYMLLIDEALNVEPFTHMAYAGPIPPPGQGGTARFVTFGKSAVEAAEAGVAVLRGIVERGDPWPS